MSKIRITWNGQGGELDYAMVDEDHNDDHALTTALMEMIRGEIVAPGDSFTVEEVKE